MTLLGSVAVRVLAQSVRDALSAGNPLTLKAEPGTIADQVLHVAGLAHQ